MENQYWPKWPKAIEKDLARYVVKDCGKHLELSVNRQGLLRNKKYIKLICAAYNAVRAKNIRYSRELFNFEKNTQVIRHPIEEILKASNREGTCLDLSLLLAGILFSYDLFPVVVVLQGHAFVAVSIYSDLWDWQPNTQDWGYFSRGEFEGFEGGILKDRGIFRRLIEDKKFLPIECTGFAESERSDSQSPENQKRENGLLSFRNAVRVAREQLCSDCDSREFKFALDVAGLFAKGVVSYTAHKKNTEPQHQWFVSGTNSAQIVKFLEFKSQAKICTSSKEFVNCKCLAKQEPSKCCKCYAKQKFHEELGRCRAGFIVLGKDTLKNEIIRTEVAMLCWQNLLDKNFKLEVIFDGVGKDDLDPYWEHFLPKKELHKYEDEELLYLLLKDFPNEKFESFLEYREAQLTDDFNKCNAARVKRALGELTRNYKEQNLSHQLAKVVLEKGIHSWKQLFDALEIDEFERISPYLLEWTVCSWVDLRAASELLAFKQLPEGKDRIYYLKTTHKNTEKIAEMYIMQACYGTKKDRVSNCAFITLPKGELRILELICAGLEEIFQQNFECDQSDFDMLNEKIKEREGSSSPIFVILPQNLEYQINEIKDHFPRLIIIVITNKNPKSKSMSYFFSEPKSKEEEQCIEALNWFYRQSSRFSQRWTGNYRNV